MSEGQPQQAPADDLTQLQDIRRRFYRCLWHYSEVYHDETSASQSAATTAGEEKEKTYIYQDQVKAMSAGQVFYQGTLCVNLAHIQWLDADLADIIVLEWHQVEPYCRQAVQKLVHQIDPDFLTGDDGKERDFHIAWTGIDDIHKLRDLRSAKVGKLISWKGTVTRTTEVRPELYLGTFKCDQCQQIVPNVEQQFVCTYPINCPKAECGNHTKWTLVREESTFVDWQRAKVQENADEVPAGSLPRAMDVILRNEMVESVRPGDKVVFTGCMIVVPDIAAFTAPGERTLMVSHGNSGGTYGKGVTGVKQVGVRELHYKLAFLANNVQMDGAKQAMIDARTEAEVTPAEVAQQLGGYMEKLRRMHSLSDIYHRLARSIAPGVYGHEDIKKAVLLMLVGGVHKTTPEGIRLRGDINVMIVGDPSTAKSQILKYVASFLPRAVFTGGKSSSAAGLTATVVKESDSREHSIEAGALMLADNGICCIDEFDKMDIKDQVAIHEAMEQQTISIAKAGIQATLNARTAILAAANPLGGRYDRAKPLKYNVNLPPAILSRFDLLHVMVDAINPAVDEAIAYHILAAHRGASVPPMFNKEDLQRYIRYARALKPRLTEPARKKLVEAFKNLRNQDAVPGSGSVYRITVRQLEALIRLSEALARVHHRTEVLPEDVAEAQRLIKASVHSAGDADVMMDLPDDENALQGDELARIWFGDDDENEEQNRRRAEPVAPPADADQGDEEFEDREGGRRVRARTAEEPRAEEAQQENAGPAQPQAAPAEAEPAQPKSTSISRKRWSYLHNHVLACLKQAEQGLLQDAAQQIETTNQTFTGLSQHAIIKWHIKTEIEKGALADQEAIVAEVQLMQKIIHVMLVREGTLIEMQVPEPRTEESKDEYAVRKEKERVLAINPNYYME